MCWNTVRQSKAFLKQTGIECRFNVRRQQVIQQNETVGQKDSRSETDGKTEHNCYKRKLCRERNCQEIHDTEAESMIEYTYTEADSSRADLYRNRAMVQFYRKRG